MSKKNDRFLVTLKEGSGMKNAGLRMVLVDRETGVNYLWVTSGYAGGLTPLLDAEGRPVVSFPIPRSED